jgi:hypothetical protein
LFRASSLTRRSAAWIEGYLCGFARPGEYLLYNTRQAYGVEGTVAMASPHHAFAGLMAGLMKSFEGAVEDGCGDLASATAVQLVYRPMLLR